MNFAGFIKLEKIKGLVAYIKAKSRFLWMFIYFGGEDVFLGTVHTKRVRHRTGIALRMDTAGWLLWQIFVEVPNSPRSGWPIATRRENIAKMAGLTRASWQFAVSLPAITQHSIQQCCAMDYSAVTRNKEWMLILEPTFCLDLLHWKPKSPSTGWKGKKKNFSLFFIKVWQEDGGQ